MDENGVRTLLRSVADVEVPPPAVNLDLAIAGRPQAAAAPGGGGRQFGAGGGGGGQRVRRDDRRREPASDRDTADQGHGFAVGHRVGGAHACIRCPPPRPAGSIRWCLMRRSAGCLAATRSMPGRLRP